MINEWEDEPTVDGVIVYAKIGNENDPCDILHVKADDVADDVGNLLRFPCDDDDECESSSKQDKPFLMIGRNGTLSQYGFSNSDDIIGKRCLLYSVGRFDMVSIETNPGEYPIYIWREFI